MASFPNFFDQVWANAPLGWVHTYASGTTTPKQAWQDAAATVTHQLPTAGVPASGIQLDANGRPSPAPIIFGTGKYTIHVYTAAGVLAAPIVDDVEAPDIAAAAAAAAGDAALLAQLASSSTPANGLGMIGADFGLTYDEGTAAGKIKARTFMTPEDFGCIGNGVADDTVPFKDFVAAVNAAGGGNVLMRGNYYIAQTGAPLTVNIEFVDCDGLNIWAVDGAKISLRGDFVHSITMTASAIVFRRCKNVLIYGLDTDGRVSTGTKTGTEQGEMGLQFFGCQRICLMNCKTHDHPNDGIYIDHEFSSGLISVASRQFQIINHDSYNNGRQGMSLIGVFGALIENSRFRDTGNTGAFGFYSPGAGVDIEPNSTQELCVSGVKFVNTEFSNNVGACFVCVNLASPSWPAIALTGNVDDIWLENPKFKTGAASTGSDQVILNVMNGGVLGGSSDFRVFSSTTSERRLTLVYSNYTGYVKLRDHTVLGPKQLLLAVKDASRSIEQQRVDVVSCNFVCTDITSNFGVNAINMNCGGFFDQNRVYMPSAAYATGSATRETVKLSNVYRASFNTYETDMSTVGQKFTCTYAGAGSVSGERYLAPLYFGI